MMTVIQELPVKIEQQVTDFLSKAGELARSGNIALSIEYGLKAWDLIPEPKETWMMYPQIMSINMANKYANIGNSEEFAKWIDIAFKMYHSPEKTELYVLSTAGEGYLKLEDYEQAYQAFHRTYEIYGKGAFRGADLNHYKFMLYYEGEKQKATLDKNAIKAYLIENGLTSSAKTPEVVDELDEDELPDDIYEEVENLSGQGQELFDNKQIDAAIEKWQQALSLLPEPRQKWEASLWLYAALGDAYQSKGDHQEALSYFERGYQSAEGYLNPYILYSIGTNLYDLNRKDEATDYLLRAYMLEGDDIFDEDGEIYLNHLKEKKLIK
ncbi:tetratricopeptide repeat protein [Bartonella sp. HY038]|uniref:tetratricopeptide repeat protein n=1 Tax=Bartonella sp. HY038 TaxID=2759660 RepID=UPI0015FBA69C|nr:tetratricopeptide repeat protein [Bartonella sp. HY038]